MHLKFVYLLKFFDNCLFGQSTEDVENTSHFESWGLTLCAYIKKCISGIIVK